MSKKRITKTWRVVKILYILPKEDYINVNNLWRRTNFKKKDVCNKLNWLIGRRLVEHINEINYENGYVRRRGKYRLSNDGRRYAKRKIEREKLERSDNVA